MHVLVCTPSRLGCLRACVRALQHVRRPHFSLSPVWVYMHACLTVCMYTYIHTVGMCAFGWVQLVYKGWARHSYLQLASCTSGVASVTLNVTHTRQSYKNLLYLADDTLLCVRAYVVIIDECTKCQLLE